jgi:hypothetical protein
MFSPRLVDQPIALPMMSNSIKSLILKYYRLALLLFSGLLITIGWSIDVGGPGRGPTQLLVGATGVVLIVIIVVDKRGRFISRLILLLVASYCTLIGCEFAIRIARRPPPAAWKQYHRLYRSDPVVGYTLTPNWRGQFNDGYAQGNIAVNSLGQRDDEPSPTAKHRILLLGDSFTFGALLDQSDTIDKKIERLSVDVDAYNLGVGGYGLPAIVETLRGCDLPGREAFYLFYNNDLQNDDLLPDNGKFVFDGHLVPRKKTDGTLYTEAEIREKIAQAIEEQESKRAVVDLRLFLLPHIRQLLVAAGQRYYGSRDQHLKTRMSPQLQMRMSPLGGDRRFSEENVRLAISHTLELRRLAAARGMSFYVVIIPTLEEVQAHEYSWPTEQYLKGIENEKMNVVPLIQSLAEKDYFLHDGHFTPGGAQVTAEAIYKTLSPR